MNLCNTLFFSKDLQLLQYPFKGIESVTVPVRKRSPYKTLSQISLACSSSLLAFKQQVGAKYPADLSIWYSWDVTGGGNTENGIWCSRGQQHHVRGVSVVSGGVERCQGWFYLSSPSCRAALFYCSRAGGLSASQTSVAWSCGLGRGTFWLSRDRPLVPTSHSLSQWCCAGFQVVPSRRSCCAAAESEKGRSSAKPAQEPQNQSWHVRCSPSFSAFPLPAMDCEGKLPWLWALLCR